MAISLQKPSKHCFVLISLVVLFLGAPLVVFKSIYEFPNSFYFLVPTTAILPLLLILRATKLEDSFLARVVIISTICLFISSLMNWTSFDNLLRSLAWPIIVYLSYELFQKECYRKQLPLIFSLVFVVNLICIYLPIDRINFSGMVGNKNWSSALTLSISPFVLFWIREKVNQSWSRYFLYGLVCIATFMVIWGASCRASFFTLLVIGLYVLSFRNFGRFSSIKILIWIALTFLSVYFVFLSKNIRAEYWTATYNLIMDNFFWGIGSTNFDSLFQNYVTTEQKLMLYESHTVEHPHNEFLFKISESGIVVGFIWLALFFKALFSSKKDTLTRTIKLSLLAFFIHGMLDKTLFVQPNEIVFYCLIGAAIDNEVYEKISVNYFKPIFFILTGLIFVSGVKSGISSWYFRSALESEKIGMNAQAINKYETSITYDSFNMRSRFYLLRLLVRDSFSVEEIKDQITFLERWHPYAGSFLLIKAKFFETLAFRDLSNREEYLGRSFAALDDSCKHHLSDLQSFEERLKFSIKYLETLKVDESLKDLVDVHNDKFLRSERRFKLSRNEIVSDWLEENTYGKLAARAEKYLGALKYTRTVSDFFPKEYRSLLKHLGGSFNIPDMKFTIESIRSHAVFRDLGLAESMQKIYLDISVDENLEFTFPQETWIKKVSTDLSRACLAAQVVMLKGGDPVLVKSETGKYSLIYFDESNIFSVVDGKVEELKTLDSVSALNVRFYYFNYPQAFFYKNYLLSNCFSIHDSVPNFCKLPGLTFRRFQQAFGNGSKLLILKEPFEFFFK